MRARKGGHLKRRKHICVILLVAILVVLGTPLLKADFEQAWVGSRFLMGDKVATLPEKFILESTLPSGLTVTAEYGLMRTHTTEGIISPAVERYESVKVTGRNWFWLLPDYGPAIQQQAERGLDAQLKQQGAAAISSDEHSQRILTRFKRSRCPPDAT